MKITNAILRQPHKFILTLLLTIVTLPLLVLFYIFRSAWEDSWQVGMWLRPPAICEHNIDRNRESCDDCNTRDEHEFMAQFNHPEDHVHYKCEGCEEVICAKEEHADLAEGDACPVCHIATVRLIS